MQSAGQARTRVACSSSDLVEVHNSRARQVGYIRLESRNGSKQLIDLLCDISVGVEGASVRLRAAMSVNTRDLSEFRAGRSGLIGSCNDRLDLRTSSNSADYDRVVVGRRHAGSTMPTAVRRSRWWRFGID